MGIIFGPFGLVAVLVMKNLKGAPSREPVKCPDCRELVLKDAASASLRLQTGAAA